jgi:hypothetical protein
VKEEEGEEKKRKKKADQKDDEKYLSLYGSTVLLLDLDCFFSFDSLDGGSARRKAATYTQNNTNTE